MIKSLQGRFYRCYDFRNKFLYSKASFLKSIFGYSLMLIVCIFLQRVETFSNRDNSYLIIGQWTSACIICLNFLGIQLFKFLKTRKYSVVIPYLSGLLFLLYPILVLNLIAETGENILFQWLIVSISGPVNLFYQLLIIDKVVNLKSSGLKQFIFSLPLFATLITSIILLIWEGSFEESLIALSWGGFLFMVLMSIVAFPQFMIVTNYWKKPLQTKSLYENVLDELK